MGEGVYTRSFPTTGQQGGLLPVYFSLSGLECMRAWLGVYVELSVYLP